jgi:hypothetical protein
MEGIDQDFGLSLEIEIDPATQTEELPPRSQPWGVVETIRA